MYMYKLVLKWRQGIVGKTFVESDLVLLSYPYTQVVWKKKTCQIWNSIAELAISI